MPDAALAGALFDDNTGAAYDPSDYAGHGDGLFFVAVEDNGHVYAFALGADGGATLVSEIVPGLTGVMALDYDSVRGVLWAVCDDGCQGRSAEITLNGTAQPGLAHYERPAGMPDINNEGFATAPASLSVDGQRPVWWFADGFASEALRTGTLPGVDGGTPGGGTPGGGTPGGGNPALPGTGIARRGFPERRTRRHRLRGTCRRGRAGARAAAGRCRHRRPATPLGLTSGRGARVRRCAPREAPPRVPRCRCRRLDS